MIREYRCLTRLEMEELDRENTIVLLPVGALEQHGNQAPLGTDSMTGEALCRRLEKAVPEEISILHLPVLPIGLSTEHINFCGSLSLSPMTLYALLDEICRGLAHHGFKKILIINCHGGNAPVVNLISRELRAELGLAIFIGKQSYSCPEALSTISAGNKNDFHGGEMETSVMLAEYPEHVKMETAKKGTPLYHLGTKMAGINWISEDYVDEDGNPIGIGGDPSGATAEKGEIILEAFTKQLVEAIVAIDQFEDLLQLDNA